MYWLQFGLRYIFSRICWFGDLFIDWMKERLQRIRSDLSPNAPSSLLTWGGAPYSLTILVLSSRCSCGGVSTLNHCVVPLARICTLTPLVLHLHFYSQWHNDVIFYLGFRHAKGISLLYQELYRLPLRNEVQYLFRM